MENQKKWNILFSNNVCPCFVADIKTDKLLYVNKKFGMAFGLDETVFEKNLYDVITNEYAMYDDIRPDWSVQKIFQTEIFNKKADEKYSVTATPIDDKVYFGEVKLLKSADWQNSFEDAMTKCMDIYNQPEDTVLFSFTKLLGQFYDCERAYVYRFNREDSTINCMSQWCEDENFVITSEIGKKMNASFLMDWLQNQGKNGMVTANKHDENFDDESVVAGILKTFNIENITLCTVVDKNHEVIGLVGLSNRREANKFIDIRLINVISKFVAQQVTEQEKDKQIFQLDNKDTMTGLYNRISYSKAVDMITENPPKTLGVISVNVNGLKYINENSGHLAGDNHIKKSAKQLREHFRYTFFRISGDEFIGIAHDLDKNQFEEKVVALQQNMKQENNLDFSFGHAFSKRNFNFYKLVREADAIMYINKQEYYHASNRHFENISDNILSDLLSCIKNDEFMVYLQPQVRLVDGTLYGAEALIRRFDKQNEKMILPDQFISNYEKKGVIRHVDIFVIKTVCKLLESWIKEGKSIPISVNLSRVTLQEYGIVDTIVKICDEHNVPHHLLVIEVTERVGLVENNVPSSLIQEFKDNGFNISLDDFGCAYSNIVTLAQLEVDEVKIDKSLVDFIMSSDKNRVLVKNVLAMCNELDGASTLAEGIEDEDQAKLLHSLGCHIGQGYLYSRPIPTNEFHDKYFS